MKYTSGQVKAMTWHEWNEAMADALNKAGFRTKDFNEKLGRWESNKALYKADPNYPKHFLVTVEDPKEVEYLKSVGLLNNGRCPMCGNPIIGAPGRFTSGLDSDYHFQICQNCCNRGRRSSINPANMRSSGCLIELLLVPWYLIKSIF
ncbi:MAG: hypothetical protein K2M06_07995 [Muribaculaceae bacterium]|nr:hypothetical protein [Muribaculaceae bacterium]